MRLTRNTLLSNNQVGLELEDAFTKQLNLLLLNILCLLPVTLLRNLHIRLTFTLLVLERTIEKDDARVSDSPTHVGMCDILVEHDTVENARLLNLPSGNLLDVCISFDVHCRKTGVVLRNRAYSLQSKLAHKLGPSYDELGADRSLDERKHLGIVGHIDGCRDAVDDGEGLLHGFIEGRNDDNRVDIPLKRLHRLRKNLAS